MFPVMANMGTTIGVTEHLHGAPVANIDLNLNLVEASNEGRVVA